MAGIEFLRAIRDGRLPHPPICALLGYRLTEVEPGHAVFEITAGERHYNPIGVVHGGIAMTLLDSAMGCAVQTQMPAGGGYTTLEAKTNLCVAISAETGRCAPSARWSMPASASPPRRRGWRIPRQALRARHEHVHRLVGHGRQAHRPLRLLQVGVRSLTVAPAPAAGAGLNPRRASCGGIWPGCRGGRSTPA
jgi:uncharacterized protein (TIGR00369 family)